MADDTDDSGGVIFEGPFDPDAQATVTDFIDYTEYLPSDLIRSLTLIRGLDETYLDAAQNVHELTKLYGQAPDLPSEQRPNLRDLRKQISLHLDRALTAREASYAESCRLYDVVDRHYDRLESIKKKLEALPKPPSRERSPPTTSPQKKRGKAVKKTEDGPMRITLRVDGRAPAVSAGPRARSRRSLIASEHLTGLDPDSPLASTEHSDNEAVTKRDTEEADELPTSTRAGKKDKAPKRQKTPRQPGMGTNAHSAVAGISTSNALALLKPPPEDAKMGSEDLPWLRLTEWEMTKLRKKMKKNAVWQPSDIMIHRELDKSGRGWEGYRAAKAKAEAAGEEVIDCDDIENNYIPNKLTRKGEATSDNNTTAPEATKLSNRGMKLNEAKKLKRETLAREQAALAAAEAELAAKRLGDIGSTFKSLFAMNNAAALLGAGVSTRATVPVAQEKKESKRSRKRKYEESSTIDALALTSNVPAAKPASKKSKVSQASPASAATEAALSTSPGVSAASIPPIDISQPRTIKVASATPPPTRSKSKATSIPPSTNLAPPTSTKPSATPTPPATRPPSRRRSVAAASVEPNAGIPTIGRDHLRRKSMTPASRTPAPEVARASSAAASSNNRRKKRPAPGPVSSGQDGGASVSYGRRKAKPAKKRAAGAKDGVGAIGDDYRIDEDGVLEEIDPNEPRYCLCGDVSFGTMICCENQDVSVNSAFLYQRFDEY